MLYPDPELERDSFIFESGATASPQSDGSLLSLLASFAGLGDGTGTTTILSIILRTRVQFRLLAVLVYILFLTENIKTYFLVPLLCWEAIEVFFLSSNVPKLGILGMLFSVCGVAPQHIPRLTMVIEVAHKIGKDVALFMYCLLVTHFVYCKAWLGHDLGTIFYAAFVRNEWHREKLAAFVANRDLD